MLRGINENLSQSLFFIYCQDHIDKTFVKAFIGEVILTHFAFFQYSFLLPYLIICARSSNKSDTSKASEKKAMLVFLRVTSNDCYYKISKVCEKSLQIAQVWSSPKARWKLCRIILIRLHDCARLQTSGYSVVTSAGQCIHCSLEFNSFEITPSKW